MIILKKYMDEIEGETQIISLILDDPIKDYRKILVSFESLNGICVLDWLVNADIQCPNFDKLPLICFNSDILIYFYACERS